MTYEDAKQRAVEQSKGVTHRIYVVCVDAQYIVLTRDELEHRGLTMQSPSPVVGFAERGLWHSVGA